MERKIGEVFECDGIKLRVEEERRGCKDCYFQRKKGWCISLKEIIGECMDSMRNDIGIIFKKVENMETRTIELTLEKAKEFYKKGGEFRELALSTFTEEELTKVELPKTWEEFCANYKVQKGECFINSNSVIEYPSIEYASPSDTLRLVCTDSNLLPNKQAAEAHLALMQLHQLRDYYRQGWKPDWEDDQRKYCIVLNSNTLKIVPSYSCNCFLSFQEKSIAEEFLTNFRGLIEQAGDLI